MSGAASDTSGRVLKRRVLGAGRVGICAIWGQISVAAVAVGWCCLLRDTGGRLEVSSGEVLLDGGECLACRPALVHVIREKLLQQMLYEWDVLANICPQSSKGGTQLPRE